MWAGFAAAGWAAGGRAGHRLQRRGKFETKEIRFQIMLFVAVDVQ